MYVSSSYQLFVSILVLQYIIIIIKIIITDNNYYYVIIISRINHNEQ